MRPVVTEPMDICIKNCPLQKPHIETVDYKNSEGVVVGRTSVFYCEYEEVCEMWYKHKIEELNIATEKSVELAAKKLIQKFEQANRRDKI